MRVSRVIALEIGMGSIMGYYIRCSSQPSRKINVHRNTQRNRLKCELVVISFPAILLATSYCSMSGWRILWVCREREGGYSIQDRHSGPAQICD